MKSSLSSTTTSLAAAAAAAAIRSSSASVVPPAAVSLTLFGPAFTRVFRCIWMLEELGLPYQHVARTLPGSRRAKALHPLGKVPMLVENYETADAFCITESANINQYLADKYGTTTATNDSRDDVAATATQSFLFVPQVGTRLRAQHDQLVFTIMTEMDAQGVWVHRKHEAMGNIFGYIPQAVEQARTHFDQVTQAILETTLHVHHQQQQQQQLQEQGENDSVRSTSPIYLLGPNLFSPADILFVHCLGWAKAIQWADISSTSTSTDDTSTATTAKVTGCWQHDDILKQYLQHCHQRPAYQRAAQIRRDENLMPSRDNKKDKGQETTSSAASSEGEPQHPAKL